MVGVGDDLICPMARNNLSQAALGL